MCRSTLLHYERIGLVRAARTASGYRRYDAAAIAQLRLLRNWRAAGLSLAQIGELLASAASRPRVLREHLRALDAELAALSARRRHASALLPRPAAGGAAPLTKSAWVAMFRSIGLDERQMRAWHRAFERDHAAAHEAFLRSLGLPPAEVARIRHRSRGGG